MCGRQIVDARQRPVAGTLRAARPLQRPLAHYRLPPVARIGGAHPVDTLLGTRCHLLRGQIAVGLVVLLGHQLRVRSGQIVDTGKRLPARAHWTARTCRSTAGNDGRPAVARVGRAHPVSTHARAGSHLLRCQITVDLLVPLGGELRMRRREIVDAGEHPPPAADRTTCGVRPRAVTHCGLPAMAVVDGTHPVHLLARAGRDLLRRQIAVGLVVPPGGKLGDVRDRPLALRHCGAPCPASPSAPQATRSACATAECTRRTAPAHAALAALVPAARR